MLSVNRPAARWRVVMIAAALVLLLAGIALIPPGTIPYAPRATYSDAQVSHWPNAYFFREAVLEQHAWPLWNPMRMLGQPFSANPLSKVWYPPQWLALILPPTIFLNLMTWLHLALLGAGMVIWARGDGRRRVTALFMALAWGLNPKLIAHLGTGHYDILYALAWTPWLMWSVRRLVDRPEVWRGVSMAIIMALLVLADVRMAAYFIPVSLIYGIAILPGLRLSARQALCGALAAGLMLLLTAVQTVPLLTIGPYLTRAAISPQDAAELSLRPQQLFGLILPDIGGQHEWMTALGMPVLLLAFYAPRTGENRRQTFLLWVVVAAAFLWALGNFGPIFLPAVTLVPALTWLRVPSRAWFVVAFCMIALAGLGLDALLSRGPGRLGRLASMGFVSAGLSGMAAALFVPGLPGAVAFAGASLAGTGAGVLAISPSTDGRQRSFRAGAAILAATLFVSLIGHDLTLVIPHNVRDVIAEEQAIISQLDPACRNVYSPSFEMIGPATMSSGLVTLHGVDPFELKGSAEFIANAAGVSLHGYSVISPPMPPGETELASATPDIDRVRRAGVCAVISEYPMKSGGLRQSSSVGEVRIYEVVTSPAISPERDSVWHPMVFGWDQVTTTRCLDDAQAQEILISQSWAPGWQAWVDGHPAEVRRVDGGAMFSIPVSGQGCHTLALAYRPIPDLIGLAISAVTVLCLGGAWVISSRRRTNA